MRLHWQSCDRLLKDALWYPKGHSAGCVLDNTELNLPLMLFFEIVGCLIVLVFNFCDAMSHYYICLEGLRITI